MGENPYITSDALRSALYYLVMECYDSNRDRAAEDLGYPRNTFWRSLALPGRKGRNQTVSLEFVMDVYGQLASKFPERVPDFTDFYLRAARFVEN